jgi:hypothetical protein
MTAPIVVGAWQQFAGDGFVDLTTGPQGGPPLGAAATTAGWTFLTNYKSTDTVNKQALLAINLTASTHQIQITVNEVGHLHVVSVKVTPGGTIWSGSITVDDGAAHTIAVQVPGPGAGWLRIFVDGNLCGNFAVAAGVIDAVQPVSGAGNQLGGLLPGGSGGGTFSLQLTSLFAVVQPVQDVVHDQAFPQELTGARFHRVLDMLNLPARLRNIATGTVWCSADTTDESQTKVLSYLQKLEQTEQGQCYVAADGTLVFRDRAWRAAHVTSSAVFSDRDRATYPTDLPYSMGGVTLNFDRAELFNEIPVTRRFGTAVQMAVDGPKNPPDGTSSVERFTQRTMPGLTDLLMASDAEAMACAGFILFGDGGTPGTYRPQYRVGDLVINPLVDDRLWPIVLGLDIGDVITVIKSRIPGGGTPITLLCRIEGVEHEITPPTSWTTTWHVSLV